MNMTRLSRIQGSNGFYIFLIIYLWLSATTLSHANDQGWLMPGETLLQGQSLGSPNGQYVLWMQDDGNLVQYGPNGAMFATSTYAQGARLVMQVDGNLVLYDAANHALWSSGTQGNNGALLAVQDDGNLVVYAADQHTPLWDSRSNRDPVANCLPQSPAALIYNETILPARDDIVVRLQPLDAPCTDTGERVDIDLDERIRVRGTQNGWFYIDAIVDRNGNVLRNATGWVHNSDVGTNEAVRVYWDEGGVEAWNMDVTIRVDDTTDDVFFNQNFRWNHGGAGYFGFQQFPEGRKFIFSLYSNTFEGPGSVASFDSEFDCEPAHDEPGIVRPHLCLSDFNWEVGEQYTLRLWRLGDEAEGTRWGAWILDANGNDILHIGNFVVRTLSTDPHYITSVTSFLEDFDNIRDCSVPASTRFHVAPPSFNNGSDSASYSGHSIGPCSNGSTAGSTRFTGGRELRFNVY